MNTWPVSMAQKVARPKKSRVMKATASTVFITAARSKNPQNRAMRQLNAPTTA